MNRSKVVRDPIHDTIVIEDNEVLCLLNSRPFQRLRFIRQLGYAWLVYPGAEHSRFTHSLGVYHVAKRLMEKLKIPDERTRILVLCAALLHDIGHGPFSHQFERFLKSINYKFYQKHDKWSSRIITSDPMISNILSSVDEAFAADVAAMLLSGESKPDFGSIISSKFDADRLDYMLRDCHMTGVHYGKFDFNWLLRCLHPAHREMPEDDDASKFRSSPIMAVDARRGLCTLEQYILGLFHLYQNVYYHKTVLAAESMLTLTLKRVADLIKNDYSFTFPDVFGKIARDEQMEIDDYLSLTDFEVIAWLRRWADTSKDKVLSELSNRLLNRQLFKTIRHQLGPESLATARTFIVDELKKRNLDPDYYFTEDEPSRTAYDIGDSLSEGIFVLDEEGKVWEFSKYALHLDLKVSSKFSELSLDEHYLIVHPDIHETASRLIGSLHGNTKQN